MNEYKKFSLSDLTDLEHILFSCLFIEEKEKSEFPETYDSEDLIRFIYYLIRKCELEDKYKAYKDWKNPYMK